MAIELRETGQVICGHVVVCARVVEGTGEEGWGDNAWESRNDLPSSQHDEGQSSAKHLVVLTPHVSS